jgi:hypothetical protein
VLRADTFGETSGNTNENAVYVACLIDEVAKAAGHGLRPIAHGEEPHILAPLAAAVCCRHKASPSARGLAIGLSADAERR